MSHGFSVEVEDVQPGVILRPRGVLDAYTAPDLRAALLRALAGQPPAILIDVTGMTLGDAIALTVVATAAQQSERWPGSRIVLAPVDAAFGSVATELGIDRSVALCPSVAAALSELSGTPVPPLMRRHIVPDRDAPGTARSAVIEFCQGQRLDRNNDTAQLVASELVTNAVIHAGTAIELTLRLSGGHLHIAVRDDAPGRPRIAGIVDESSVSGRGLLLVDALAAEWGTMFPDSGKVVWATVKVRTASDLA